MIYIQYLIEQMCKQKDVYWINRIICLYGFDFVHIYILRNISPSSQAQEGFVDFLLKQSTARCWHVRDIATELTIWLAAAIINVPIGATTAIGTTVTAAAEQVNRMSASVCAH